jgi:uncharacterized glyoxalase superfamily protein PhnB/catechol 2,3-dioxygenase-like lactoylglutathione lyase family enzyme
METTMSKSNIRYIVDDVEKSIEIYTDLLGFEVQMHPAPGFAALRRDNLRLFLNKPGAGGAGQAMPDGQLPEPGGWNRIQISTDDLESFYSELNDKGASFRNEIVEGKGGKQVLLQDPSGNLIELFESTQKASVQPIPEGYHTITPFLLTDNAENLIEFIKEAFNGEVEYLMKSGDGKIRFSTVRIGDSLAMISSGTEKDKPMPCMLHLYVKDVDSVYEQAVRAGGESLREPAYEFYGDRLAAIKDDWDNQWWIATHIENVSEEEMEKRQNEFREQQG